MLPAFDERGNLPPGLHGAGWAEFAWRFGCTGHGRALIAGMSGALWNLRRAGRPAVCIDGRLATAKQHPRDCDGRRDETGANRTAGSRVRNLGDKRRKALKAKYRGELFPAGYPAQPGGETFKRFFQADRDGASRALRRLT